MDTGLTFALPISMKQFTLEKSTYKKGLRVLFGLFAIVTQVQCAKPLSPQEACGFVQNNDGQRVSWKAETPIKIYIDSSVPAQYTSSIENAMTTWEKAIGRKVFVLAGKSTSTPGQDGKNVIYWLTNWDSNATDQQANTTLYWVDNQVTEADIRVDAKNFSYSLDPGGAQVDMESLILHELGHVLGRKHEDIVPSVMAKALGNGIKRRDLFGADLKDVKCEY